MRKLSVLNTVGATVFLSAALLACSNNKGASPVTGPGNPESSSSDSSPSSEQLKNDQAFALLSTYADSEGNAIYSLSEAAVMANDIAKNPNVDVAEISEIVTHLRGLIETHRGQEELDSPNALYDSKTAMALAIRMQKHGIPLKLYQKIFEFFNIGVRQTDANGVEHGFALEVNEAARATDSLIDRTIEEVNPKSIFANDFNLTSTNDNLAKDLYRKELEKRFDNLWGRYEVIQSMKKPGSNQPLLQGRSAIKHVLAHAMENEADYLDRVEELSSAHKGVLADTKLHSDLTLELGSREAELDQAREELKTRQEALAAVEAQLDSERSKREEQYAPLATKNSELHNVELGIRDVNEELSAIASELPKLEEELAQRLAAIGPLQEQVNSAEAALSKAERSLVTAKGTRSYGAVHMQNYQRRLNKRNEALSAAKARRDSLTAAKERLAETEAKIQSLETRKKDRSADLQSLSARKDQLENQRAEAQSQFFGFLGKLTVISDERQEISAALAERIAGLKVEGGLEYEIDVLRQRLSDSTDRISEAQKLIDVIESEIDALPVR